MANQSGKTAPKKRSIRKTLLSITAVVLAPALATPASAQQLLRDAEIEEFLDDYSRPVFNAAGLKAENIDILLLAGPPNAFAGGQTMGIFTGLITTADTPNQIEGVIAHEAGHILGGHTARRDEAFSAASRPVILSLVLAAGAIAAGAPEAGIGLLGLGQNIGLANALKYSRGQEASADQSAVTTLDNLGHSSKGLIEFFAKLRNFQVITGRRVNPYLQTHPLANARITALTERVTKSPYYDNDDSPEEIHRLRMIQAKIHGFLEEAHVTLRLYPATDESEPARYARAVAYYRAADIDKALKEIDWLLERHPENQYFHELKGQMLFEFGRVKDAVAPHQKSVELDPTEALFRINLGRALIALEDKSRMQEAVNELRSALLVERNNSFAWFELARAYGALENEPMANLATAESRYHAGAGAAAVPFARRAMARLPQGSPEWRQAADILFSISGDSSLAPAPAPEQQRQPSPAPQREYEYRIPAPEPVPTPVDVPDPVPTKEG